MKVHKAKGGMQKQTYQTLVGRALQLRDQIVETAS